MLHKRLPGLLLPLVANAALILAPLLAAQGRAVRRTTPRLPGANGAPEGIVNGAPPTLRLLVLGESTVAGVGAPTHAEALTGQLATALAGRLQRAVAWQALGQIGATAADVRRSLIPTLSPEPVDLALLALGVNDSLRMRSPQRWQRDLVELIAALRTRVGPAPIFLAAVPPIGRFPVLPQPLRAVLGLRAQLLDHAAARLASARPDVIHLPMTLPVTPAQFCPDGFHPGPVGYQAWAALLADGIVKAGSNQRRPLSEWP